MCLHCIRFIIGRDAALRWNLSNWFDFFDFFVLDSKFWRIREFGFSSDYIFLAAQSFGRLEMTFQLRCELHFPAVRCLKIFHNYFHNLHETCASELSAVTSNRRRFFPWSMVASCGITIGPIKMWPGNAKTSILKEGQRLTIDMDWFDGFCYFRLS